MREYELFLVVNPELGKQELADFEKRLVDLISKNGGVLFDLEGPDKVRLVYEVRSQTRGHRYIGRAYLPPESVSELLRNFRITEQLLRFFVMLKGEAEISAEQLEELRAKPLRQLAGVGESDADQEPNEAS
ncbi:MAG: 30S ribosomal protein S6 [Nitrospirota bacterium]|jgi:small subunit ribosomal protein S6|nr:30S ribosomal protein S6 [Nitrospirota bacterium]